LLERLDQTYTNSVMVEGGAGVITSFLGDRLVDFLVLTISPALVGGYHALGRLLTDEKQPNISSFPRLKTMSAVRLGPDLVIWGRMESS
jgi:riboflavin biosynthesis pyrimidine reductase